jgi:hypothetical protein
MEAVVSAGTKDGANERGWQGYPTVGSPREEDISKLMSMERPGTPNVSWLQCGQMI